MFVCEQCGAEITKGGIVTDAVCVCQDCIDETMER